jgi:hypothetical protein
MEAFLLIALFLAIQPRLQKKRDYTFFPQGRFPKAFDLKET